MTSAVDAMAADASGLIFLEPVFVDRVWGGDRLTSLVAGDPSRPGVGECWSVSALPEADCRVADGPLAGVPLSRLWTEHPDLMRGEAAGPFPLLIKYIDACEDLSVQVHPDDAYASSHEGGLGKSECWYVLAPSDSGTVQIGHTARTRAELADMVAAGEWDRLLRHAPMERGSFFWIPAGTVHSIGAGSLIYEVQQSSDITYRLYDHGRVAAGAARPLHIEQALDVATVPGEVPASAPIVTVLPGAMHTLYTSNEHFSFGAWDVTGSARIEADAPYLICGVLRGEGRVNGRRVSRGQHFIVPTGVRRLDVDGGLELAVTSPRVA